ncbi:MAG: type IV pilus secretin PilQ [Acidobacteriia bacterium]|nr:type IV pilus secretin PilQ [Terriglobia bacterium]
MRLKQLLGILFLLLILSAMAAGAGSQLTAISVTGQGQASTVILHASGAFTHTEYRPVDQTLLVDLAGVAPGTLKDTAKAVNLPGVVSYRVLGYTGNSGAEVTRVEITLSPGAVVNVSEIARGVQLRVTGAASAAAEASELPKFVPAAAKTSAAAKPAAHAAAHPVLVRKISVVRGKTGMEVEISASAPLTPKLMKLTAPDRLVVDLLNAIPAGHPGTIMVNGAEVKSVRMGRFQQDPPVTRVVVDLIAPRDCEIVPAGNRLVLKLRAQQSAVADPASQPAAAAAAPPPAAEAPKPVTEAMIVPAAMKTMVEPVKPQVAADVVMVEPKFTTKPAEAELDPKAVAQAAAQVVAKNAPDPHSDAALLPAPSAALGAPATNLAAQQQQQMQRAAQAPAQPGQRYTGEPISVNLKDVDLKDFFRLIHEISGLNIVLDPNVRGSLTLVLDDVPWDQALDIVLQNNGLDRRLEGNVLRIATRETFTKEAESRRAQAEALALAVDKVQVTHFLSYAQATAIMPIVKKFLSQRGDVIADPRTNALIITDIPSTIPEIQRIMSQLDRKTQEVEIEARVVSATRNFARDIGVQLGFGWGNSPTAVGGAGAVGTSPLLVTLPGGQIPNYFATAGAIPLFSNLPAVGPTSGISFSNATANYRVDAILTMAESRGLLKILSRPRVVTQNNIGATMKQGVKIPVVTAAQLGGPPTTTYVDAELRLQVTPQITVENTIFLNVDVENTTPDFSRQVQGNPTLLTQQATTQVLVTDGGTVVIGGVIQTSNSVSVFQVPLLGDIPILGNLFKRRSVSTQTQELIFFITPKIVQT